MNEIVTSLTGAIKDIDPEEIDREFSMHIAETEADMEDALSDGEVDGIEMDDEGEWKEENEDDNGKPRTPVKADAMPTVPSIMSMYISQIGEIGEYTHEQMTKRMHDYRAAVAEGNTAKALRIRNDIAEHNLRLVIAVSKQYRRSFSSAEIADVIQTGNEGLLHAVERFDPDMGYKFSTYAWWWIRQYIGRAVQDNRSNVKLSTALAIDVGKASFFLARDGERGTAESIRALRKEFGWTAKHAREVVHYMKVQRMGSLNSFAGGKDGTDNETEIGDMIPDETNQFERTENVIVNNALANIIRMLPHENAADIMMRYYGIGDYTAPQTLDDIAGEYMMPKTKIQSIIRKSLSYLNAKPELHDALARIGQDF